VHGTPGRYLLIMGRTCVQKPHAKNIGKNIILPRLRRATQLRYLWVTRFTTCGIVTSGSCNGFDFNIHVHRKLSCLNARPGWLGGRKELHRFLKMWIRWSQMKYHGPFHKLHSWPRSGPYLSGICSPSQPSPKRTQLPLGHFQGS
jgi:hypothetical protein